MGATPADVSNTFGTQMGRAGRAKPLVEASPPGDPTSGACGDFYAQLKTTCQKDETAGAGQRVQGPTTSPGVSNCYVFKSLLQEYAQKVGLPTPVYETIREGPSHQPSFTSTVVVAGARYDSLPGFQNRKAAEQSAAEIALMELSKCGESKVSSCVPVHETGLCKNLLQDYSQKMNYALPTYTCKRDDTPGKTLPFSCTVEIGGIRYIGAAAKTKKEAEIKAARTALLAIQSSTSIGSKNLSIKSEYTVVPPKRKVPDTPPSQAVEKPKKKQKRPRLRKRRHNQKHKGNEGEQIEPEDKDDVLARKDDTGTEVAAEQTQNGSSDDQVSNHGQTIHTLASSAQDCAESSNVNHPNGETSAVNGSVSQAASCLPGSDSNIDSVTCSAPKIDANRVPNVAIKTSCPSSQDMGGSISDSRICSGESDANGEPSVAKVACVTTDPPPLDQMDALVPDSMVCQGTPDANRQVTVADGDGTSTGTDPDVSASGIAVCQGEPAPALAADPREDNTSAASKCSPSNE